MSVPEQVPYKEYRATGSNNSFEITFYLPDPKDLVVMVNKEIPPVGAYSIQGNTVVFNTPPNEGDLVELTRDTQLDRETNFKSYDNSFRPETINFDLDKIWLVLQEQNLVDAKILARLKAEIEWRRTHDFNYDELAQVREKQLFDALKGYTDTLNAATNPGVFQGVIAGVVFAQDGKSIQTHLEEILEALAQERENIDSKADQTYVEEQLDLKANQDTTYSKTEVDSALDQKASKVDTYTKPEVDTALSAVAAGHKAYTTLALAQAAQGTLPVNTIVEVTNDPTASNNGTYQWNGTTLTKSAYDPKTQAVTEAKTYADTNKLDLSKIITEYVDGNKIGPKTPRYTNLGLGGTFAIQAATNYDSVVLRVKAGDILFLLNDKQQYNPSSGAGFAFFVEDPNINRTQARIADNRVSAIDSATTLNHQKVTVPAGAKYLMINTRFTNSSAVRTDFAWAIHSGTFSSSYITGIEVVSEINGAMIMDSESISIQTGFDGGNLVKNTGALYDNLGVSTGGISNSTSFSSVIIPVTPGDVLFLFNSANNYSAAAGYGIQFHAENPDSNRTQTPITFTSVTETDSDSGISYRKITVPAEASFLFLNTRFSSTMINWAVHKGSFSPSYDKGVELVEKINNLPIGIAPPDLPIEMLNGSSYRFFKKKVYCFGDSITQGTEGGYVQYLSQILGCEILNYGMSGSAARRLVDIVTAGSGIPRRDSNTESTVFPTKDYTLCSAVTIQIGTNDAHGGAISDLPTTDLSDYVNPLDYWALFPSNYVSNIALCIEYIRSKNSDCEIFLIAPPYRNVTGDTPARMAAALPFLRAVSEYYSVPLINSMQESGIGFKYMKANIKYSYDGIHFNALGNKIWGKYIARKILSGG